ncbi:MAG: hypothetical protein M1822_001957 [Bathelium mastoideum]|nr:MAG: hypothetical protein M1822_001957 [Bathelium mastoideum]
MTLKESAHSIRLDSSAIVRAQCKRTNGEEVEASLDLNPVIGNNDGHFDAPGQNFAATASNVHLKGFNLHADLRKIDGKYRHDTLDLSKCLTNEDGRLSFRLGQFLAAKRSHWKGSSAVSRICDTCKGFPISTEVHNSGNHWNAKGKGAVFLASLHQIGAEKDRSKCPVCDLILRIAKHLSKEDSRYANPNTICGGGRSHGGPTWVYFEFREDNRRPRDADHRRFLLYSKEGVRVESETFIDVHKSRHIISDPTSDQAVAQARNWIDTCIQTHSKCASSANELALPARILDLGHDHSEIVRLVVTDDQKGFYACLSYCWGPLVPIKLMQHNMAQFQTGILIASLPKTYRDAIAFCRRLAIRYLWVDAVCIVQDSPDDWIRESVKMDRYYGCSILCLAATSSADLDTGCNAHTMPIEFNGKGRDNKPYTLFLRPEINHIAHGDFDHERSNLFPLLTRAWCYQERRLAPRVLHFAGNELFFECTEMNACECGEPGSRVQSTAWTKDKEVFYVRNYDISSMDNRKQRVQHEWFALARGFSGLSITYTSDRLPAISGMAKRYKESAEQLGMPCGRYLAGLWENQLIDGMAWCIGKDLTTYRKEGNTSNIGVATGPSAPLQPKPKEYIAPSWSWASVLDQTQYNTPFSKPLCTVVHAETSLATDAPLGRVKDGSVILCGKLRSCRGEWIGSGYLPGYWGLPDLPGTKLRQCMKWYPDHNIEALKGQHLDLFLMPLTSRPRGERYRFAAAFLSLGDLTVYLVLMKKGAVAYERIGWAYTNGRTIDVGSQDTHVKIV